MVQQGAHAPGKVGNITPNKFPIGGNKKGALMYTFGVTWTPAYFLAARAPLRPPAFADPEIRFKCKAPIRK